ncbi:MAG TPA: prepilin-type N-terminal cleavage/methylation domain-containing protein [Bacillota bacterium]|nr:prepilin-type N-terminal cleavage/methylation domain-containing protein [Bacillota bacterium]
MRIAKALRQVQKKEKGFTLIELLIVVAIIAVLVAIILPIFTNQVNKARTSADKANERLLQAQVDLFLAEGNEFNDTSTFIEELVAGGYLREGEVKSPFGADYELDTTNYTVKSTARDQWVEVDSGAGGGGGEN